MVGFLGIFGSIIFVLVGSASNCGSNILENGIVTETNGLYTTLLVYGLV